MIDAVGHVLAFANANHGGAFATSREADAIVDDAHAAVADFLNVPSGDEVVFGQNMTSLTFALSRALARTWKPGDEVVVTRLDHDANVSPWTLAARDAGAIVHTVDLRPGDCTLDSDSLTVALTPRTRLVAVGLASNVVGTINPVAQIVSEAKRVGALTFVDAVHYAPHGPIDVAALGCDFLACSAYKFFGPHVGILWGRRDLLTTLDAYKVRPAPDAIPGKWMTGTQNHEGIAGVGAAIAYLADLAADVAGDRRARLRTAMARVRDVERALGARLLAGLAARPRFRVWGIRGPDRLDERVPTVSFTDRYLTPRAIAEHLAQRGICAWNGNNYALETSTRLGLEPHGFVRLGLVHINTADEVDATLAALDELPTTA